MIECSLQEAVKRCKKDGGTFELKVSAEERATIYYIDDGGYIKNRTDEQVGIGWVDAFEETWIYKPPRNSAFQMWFKEVDGEEYYNDDFPKRYNKFAFKEAWNAAIDAVLNKALPGDFEDPGMAYRETIKKLKEK
jgi:hypothetical protein